MVVLTTSRFNPVELITETEATKNCPRNRCNLDKAETSSGQGPWRVNNLTSKKSPFYSTSASLPLLVKSAPFLDCFLPSEEGRRTIKEKEIEKRTVRKEGEGVASFVKGRQCGTWCTITPATRAHGVRVVPGG